MRFPALFFASIVAGVTLGVSLPGATAQEFSQDEVAPSSRTGTQQVTNRSVVIPAQAEAALLERAAVEAATPTTSETNALPPGSLPVESIMRGK